MLGKELAPYVQIVEAQKPTFRREKKVIPYKTREETIRWFAENHQNVKNQETGRINQTGEYGGPAHTVCPYAPHYLDNIEDGIKPVVRELFQKGYLTISSCEGHSWGENRYVTVAFPSEQERENLKNVLASKFIPFLGLVEVAHMTNAKVELYEDGSFKRVTKTTDEAALQEIWKGEVAYCNIVFYRKYDFYCFLRIAIGPEWVSFNANTRWLRLIYHAKQIYFWTVRKLFTEYSTRKVTKLLASSLVPKFLG